MHLCLSHYSNDIYWMDSASFCRTRQYPLVTSFKTVCQRSSVLKQRYLDSIRKNPKHGCATKFLTRKYSLLDSNTLALMFWEKRSVKEVSQTVFLDMKWPITVDMQLSTVPPSANSLCKMRLIYWMTRL